MLPMPHDDTTLAALIGAALGFLKVVEIGGRWAFTKLTKNGRQTIVSLDHETSRLIRETAENSINLLHIVDVRDQNGTPMVYSSRTAAESIQQLAVVMREISSSQERIVHYLEKLTDNVDDNARRLEQLVAGRPA